MVKAAEIRQEYLDFFKKRGHVVILSAPIVPENDPTTLFTSSGMQPLVPYLLGQPHPAGKRLVNSQPSFRAEDIEEVGDNRHTTFFEMLGNWSLGDYFKEEQLAWFWEFLTQELGLPPERLWVSVFAGSELVPRDEETARIWQKLGVPKERIFHYGVKKNWWSRSGPPDQMPAGEPGGPDSEVFFEFTQVEHDPKFGEDCHPNCDCGRFLEIGNSVFMQYQKQSAGSLEELPQKNVDFGGGLERLTAAANDQPDVFLIDLFTPIMAVLEGSLTPAARVVADHIRAAVFLVAGGVLPANKLQGYVLRRLLRRAMLKLQQQKSSLFPALIDAVVQTYADSNYLKNSDVTLIKQTVAGENDKFEKTLRGGLKKLGQVSPFDLYQSYGFPPEVIEELYRERNLRFERDEFERERQRHQELSRTASAGMFKGGLAQQSDAGIKYHTATHLLHAALRQVLGNHVQQKGSNITSERLRFDFSHPAKLTADQIKQVEGLVNQKIDEDMGVERLEMDKDKALAMGALAFFPQKYPARTSVYKIGDFSLELCGGPHVASTGRIGHIKITRQEAVARGVRRVYAQLATPD